MHYNSNTLYLTEALSDVEQPFEDADVTIILIFWFCFLFLSHNHISSILESQQHPQVLYFQISVGCSKNILSTVLHAISGCDTTSAFFNFGKYTLWVQSGLKLFSSHRRNASNEHFITAKEKCRHCLRKCIVYVHFYINLFSTSTPTVQCFTCFQYRQRCSTDVMNVIEVLRKYSEHHWNT